MIDPRIYIVSAAAFGGAARSFFGYVNNLGNGEASKFNWKKALQSVLRGLAAGVTVSLTFNLDPLAAFLVAFVGDVALHDLGFKA